MKVAELQRLARRGERLYRTKLKRLLEPEHGGEYVAIEVESGDYFLGKSDVEAIQNAKAKYPSRKFHLIKIGFPAAVSFKHPVVL